MDSYGGIFMAQLLCLILQNCGFDIKLLWTFLRESPFYNKDKLITGIKAREILSKAGRERALRYDWRHINKQWEELIDDILQYEVSIKERKLAEVKMEEV